MANHKLWELMQNDLELQLDSLDLKELSMILDCYYKTGIVNQEHHQKIVAHLMERRYSAQDFKRELTVNEMLRFFRGLFQMESIPDSLKFHPIFSMYKDAVHGVEDKLNVSTWLTVIETCRQSQQGLNELLQYSKKRFTEIYDKDMFSTEGSGSSGGLSSAEQSEQRKQLRHKKPKSVLLSKQRDEKEGME